MGQEVYDTAPDPTRPRSRKLNETEMSAMPRARPIDAVHPVRLEMDPPEAAMPGHPLLWPAVRQETQRGAGRPRPAATARAAPRARRLRVDRARALLSEAER